MEVVFAITAVQNAGKALSVMKSLRNFKEALDDPEVDKFLILWYQLQGVNKTLSELLNFQKREATFEYVESAVAMAIKTIEKIELFLSIDLDIEGDDGRPANRKSWSQWLNKKRNGIHKKEKLPELSERISHTIQLMTMAMTTVSAVVPVEQRMAKSNYVWESTAFEAAHSIFLEFQTGRMSNRPLGSGEFYQYDGGEHKCLGRAQMILKQNDDSKYLEVSNAPQGSLKSEEDLEAEDQQFSFNIPLNSTFNISQMWGSDTEDNFCFSPNDVVFKIKDCFVSFESVYRIGEDRSERTITAELFEIVTTMLATDEQDEMKLRKILKL